MIRPARRPIVGLTVFFVAGTWAGSRMDIPADPLLPVAALLLAAAAALTILVPSKATPRQQSWMAVGATLALLLATFCAAFINMRLAAQPPADPDIGSFAPGTNPVPAEIVGTVSDEPVAARTTGGAALWKFPIDVARVRLAGEAGNHAAGGTARVSLYLPLRVQPRYGDRWVLAGQLTRQGEAGRPRIILTASSGQSRRLSEGHGNRFLAWCLDCRQRARELLTLGISDFPEQTAILNSLLLGYRSQMPFDLYRDFAATGTLHVFAISGSHVVVLGGAIIFALSAAGLPRTRWVFVLGPLLILYTVMTGLQPSAVRACLMGMVFWLAPAIGRKPDIYASLGIAAILILAVEPGDIADIGFLLSFAAVLGIVLLYQPLYGPMERLLAVDPLRVQPESRWVAALRYLGRQIAGLFAVSTAACLSTAPLTAIYFGTVSPISLVGNLLAVPLASLVIVTGCISLAFGSVAGFLADLFNHANLALVALLGASIRLLARVPGGYFQIPPPAPWLVAVFYSALALWLFQRWAAGSSPEAARGDGEVRPPDRGP